MKKTRKMNTDQLYSKVYASVLVITSNRSFEPSGTVYFKPRERQIKVGKYLQVVENQTCGMVEGEISGPGGNYITLPATYDGLTWDVEIRFIDYNTKAEFVIESYPGAEIIIGD